MVKQLRFVDRADAGIQLAAALQAHAGNPNVLVLGLPRGGVPVAFEVAKALYVALDVFVVRKLGVPGHRELAMGAIASGRIRVLNREVIKSLALPDSILDAIARQEAVEIERQQQAYRGDAPFPDLANRVIIVVDDGLATGSTMLAAVRALRQTKPAKIIVAVPVGASDTCTMLRAEADEMVCLQIPADFQAVSVWYQTFPQTTDQEVRTLLATSPAVR